MNIRMRLYGKDACVVVAWPHVFFGIALLDVWRLRGLYLRGLSLAPDAGRSVKEKTTLVGTFHRYDQHRAGSAE